MSDSKPNPIILDYLTMPESDILQYFAEKGFGLDLKVKSAPNMEIRFEAHISTPKGHYISHDATGISLKSFLFECMEEVNNEAKRSKEIQTRFLQSIARQEAIAQEQISKLIEEKLEKYGIPKKS